MSTEKEILMIQKAAMYDLIEILEEHPETVYTVEELKAIIKAYLKGTQS